MIEDDITGQPVAWFPTGLVVITTHPSGRTWAGSAGYHVYLVTVEGNVEPLANQAANEP